MVKGHNIFGWTYIKLNFVRSQAKVKRGLPAFIFWGRRIVELLEWKLKFLSEKFGL